MLAFGIFAILIASALQCWHAANKAAAPSNCAIGFFGYGTAALTLSIVLLAVGSASIWVGWSFLGTIVAVVAYFFVLPLAILPFWQRLYPAVPEAKTSDAEWARVAGLNDPPKNSPQRNDFWIQLYTMIQYASDQGESYVDINAGELHRNTGFYPGNNHRMPVCCDVMREEMQAIDIIIQQPPKGNGATLTIRYGLPRIASDPEIEKVNADV